MRYCMMPAPSRRATMPTARRIATPTNSASTAQSIAGADLAVSKAGSTTLSVDQPSTQASATVSAPKSRLPRVERAKIQGSRWIATPSTANPSRVVRSAWLRLQLRHLVRSPSSPSVPPTVRVFQPPNPLPAGAPVRAVRGRLARAMSRPSARARACMPSATSPSRSARTPPPCAATGRSGTSGPPAGARAQPARPPDRLVVPPLSALTDRATDKAAREDFAELVDAAPQAAA